MLGLDDYQSIKFGVGLSNVKLTFDTKGEHNAETSAVINIPDF